MTKLASVGKISIAIELAKAIRNYVATELAATENSSSQDKPGVRELSAQRHALGANSTEARAIEESCCDKLYPVFLSQQRFLYHDRLLTAMLSVAMKNFRTWDFPCRNSAMCTVGLAC